MLMYKWCAPIIHSLSDNTLTLYLMLYDRSSSLSSQSNVMPGRFVIIFMYTASPGCTRITSSLRWICPRRKISPGTSRNCIRTSALRSLRAVEMFIMFRTSYANTIDIIKLSLNG